MALACGPVLRAVPAALAAVLALAGRPDAATALEVTAGEQRWIVADDAYDAFPVVERLRSGELIALYSQSRAHAAGTRQRLLIADRDAKTWRNLPLEPEARDVHPQQTLDALRDALADGEIVVLRTMRFARSQNDVTVTRLPSFVKTDFGKARVWGKVLRDKDPSSPWLRTGYTDPGPDSSDRRSVLLSSSDGGLTWNPSGEIAGASGESFSEAAIARGPDGTLLAVVRADVATDGRDRKGPRARPLDMVRSKDGGRTWSRPARLDPNRVNGTQPELLAIDDRTMLLCVGDRNGAASLAADGAPNDTPDPVGASCYVTSDMGETWSAPVAAGRSQSADCGQPSLAPLADRTDAAALVYYGQPKAGRKPDIGLSILTWK